MIIFFTFLISYLIGSLPFGLIISLILKKSDPRLHGSKNIGATNILRLSGWKLGFFTLVFDAAKAFIPIKFIYALNINLSSVVILGVFIGHLFPIWLKFKGGKGVAVLIGILLSTNYEYGVLFIFSWLLIAFIFKYSSLSALISILVVSIYVFFDRNESFFLLLIILNIMIYFKHIENIKKLFRNEETKIKLKK